MRDAIVVLSGKKNWYIASARNMQQKFFLLSFSGEVFFQTFTQCAGIAADNIVATCVIALCAAEDLETDLLFIDFRGSAAEFSITNEEQKVAQQRRTPEVVTGHDALYQHPSRIICMCRKNEWRL
ncbi:hypothetical protein [Paracidobacterium acidisoli]|uniref:hypothetical protein n=1 Tax=Paracidobacterium acidisoli TaxID=2303751 RepID=UPI0011C114C7|nr:hypothetical protein [Paracidobacterium acidisoli]MBT9330625.1 hypothetical protein [Paracidobacterium acidisoli]